MKKNEMYKHIVAIRTEKNNKVIGGTGFLIRTETGAVYLVTATHVARDTTTQTDIWLRHPDNGLPLSRKLRMI